MRRATLLLGGLLTAFLLVYGCFFLVDWLAVDHDTATERFAAVPTLHLDTQGGGTVRIVGDAEGSIRVDFRWREGLQSPTVDARLDGDRLVVETRCPQVVNFFCLVSATIHVPRGTVVDGGGDSPVEVVDVAGAVDLSGDNGSIHVTGAVGRVHLASDNGTVTVTDSEGPLLLRSDNGSIRTEGVRAETVDAETDNGSITLDLPTAPEAVRAVTDNGSVTVLVPDDGKPWATTVSTDNGGTEVPILTAADAGRTIEARTDNGHISIRYRR